MKTYHVITIGCQMNKSDSERVASKLEQNGYKKADNKYQADLVVVNTCGVRQTAEDRIYGLIPSIKKTNKKAKIIVTGCLVYRADIKNRLKDCVDAWLPIAQMTNVKFPMTKIPPTPFVKGEQCGDYLKIKPKHESEFSAFVPIGNGCDNFCSYCVVPYARGREVYRPAEDIAGEVNYLVKKDYKEIVLIAQNVNSYKSSIPPNPPLSRGEDFADLLKMINNIKGDFWIRFMTSHPKDMSDRLIKTMASCEKVCHHIHLPAQAGDDEVLKMMNRKYTKANYIKLVGKIRKVLNDQIPITNNQINFQFPISNFQKNSKLQIKKLEIGRAPAAITTDIIVGFPGETKKQFNNTIKLMKRVKFDMAYIARYSPRPGTTAFKLADNVPWAEKKRREFELMKILRKTALENNKKYIGKIAEVLVENRVKSGEWIGKTKTAKNVKFPMTNDKISLIGQFVNVKITKAQDFGLEGEIA